MPDIDYQRPNGEVSRGYLAEPAGTVRGNVIVIHEYWGLTDQIRRFCDRLAGEGYRVLAPDLYDGTIATSSAEANAKMSALNFPRAVNEYIRGATLHLKQLGGKAAVLGFCMGGALTLLSAAMIPELDSAVCYYGIPPAFDPTHVRVPVLMHFAKRDDWCTPANVEKLEEDFRAAGKTYELHRYDAAHAFANDNRPEVHDPAATEQAWARTLAFLAKTL